MAAVAIKNVLDHLRTHSGVACVDGDEDTALMDASFVVTCIFVADAMLLQEPAKSASESARSCTNCSRFGNCRCRDSASRYQGSNTWYCQSSDTPEGPRDRHRLLRL